MSTMVFFFVPTVIFLAVVVPMWLILHYWTRARLNKGMSSDEREQLEETLALAERLEQRVQTLETILDSEHTGWRTRRDDDR
ncbi:envelope stress response membrane protein PspB [Marinobacterium rhizophilum]|uniref:Envelope stress response membrane protein PspB n=1 Tax=Marinobacterium rhizophilum TaxID=420402 RepID=A0ABY5HMM3_9GAMM|nr:envelope stress response membrane protein PspB [Marinobacterium rhizophilum]UTW12156.1 envelope stress response membrane protein PspB [Marinobacterium rhizophilum]